MATDGQIELIASFLRGQFDVPSPVNKTLSATIQQIVHVEVLPDDDSAEKAGQLALPSVQGTSAPDESTK
jgi:hypothetical protein